MKLLDSINDTLCNGTFGNLNKAIAVHEFKTTYEPHDFHYAFFRLDAGTYVTGGAVYHEGLESGVELSVFAQLINPEDIPSHGDPANTEPPATEWDMGKVVLGEKKEIPLLFEPFKVEEPVWIAVHLNNRELSGKVTLVVEYIYLGPK